MKKLLLSLIIFCPIHTYAIGSWSCSVCTDMIQNPGNYSPEYTPFPAGLYYATACTSSNFYTKNYGVTAPATCWQNSCHPNVSPASGGAYNLVCNANANNQGSVLCDLSAKTCTYLQNGTWNPYIANGAWAIKDCTSGTCTGNTAPASAKQATMQHFLSYYYP